MTADEYYNNLKSPNKDICLKLRHTIKSKYPSFKESMLWGVPVFNNGLIYYARKY